jgi:hypothetical protein
MLKLFLCRDAGKALIIVADDLEDAKMMVNSETVLKEVGIIVSTFNNLHLKGVLNAESFAKALL